MEGIHRLERKDICYKQMADGRWQITDNRWEVRAMKKMDEMDRYIQLRAKERGYHAVLLALAGWSLFNSLQTFVNDAAFHPLPGFLLCASVCIEGVSRSVLKREMIAGDEEYREPNRLLWGIIGAVIAAAAVLSAGTYFVMRV